MSKPIELEDLDGNLIATVADDDTITWIGGDEQATCGELIAEHNTGARS